MPLEDTAPRCKGCLGQQLTRIGEKNGYALLRCGDCRTVVVNPYPTDAELEAFYTGYFLTDNYMRKSDRKLKRSRGRLKRMLHFMPEARSLLDVGCSVGFVTVSAHDLGLQAHGIDIDAKAVAIANENFAGRGRFEAVWLHDVAARGDTYDMVYMSEVLEHVNNPEAFIAATAKVLNTGGLLYLTVPDGGHTLVPRKFETWGMVSPPNHLTYFSRQGMRALLARHGFAIESFQWAFKPGIKLFARKVT